MSKNIEIATLLTCHNRREKTASCIRNLMTALNNYNAVASNKINLHIFLADDGCTDGTGEEIRMLCKDKLELHIVIGDGNLFWAGGMRLAWREALKEGRQWHYYLLLNDDTDVTNNVFESLFECHEFVLNNYGKPGIYSGITSSRDDESKVTYGGDIYTTQSHTITKRLSPIGKPQKADIVTANILLIPKEVVDSIGILYDGFIHSGADYDYSFRAQKNGFMPFVTSNICGRCDDDHVYDEDECKKLIKMTLKERKAYIYSPTRSDKDYLLLIKRTNPKKYPISVLLRTIRLYCPTIYYKLNLLRGYYKKQ